MQRVDKGMIVAICALVLAGTLFAVSVWFLLRDLELPAFEARGAIEHITEAVTEVFRDDPEIGNSIAGEAVYDRGVTAGFSPFTLDREVHGVAVRGDWVYFYTLVRTAPQNRDIVIERIAPDQMIREPVVVIEWETQGVPNISWFEVTEAGHFRFFLWISHTRADSRALVEFDRTGREISRQEILDFDVVAGDGGQIVDRIFGVGNTTAGDRAVLVSTRMGRVYIFSADGSLRGALEAGRGQMARTRDGRAAYVGNDSGMRLIDTATGDWGETLPFPEDFWITGLYSAGPDAPFDLYVEGGAAGNWGLMGYSIATGELTLLICFETIDLLITPWDHFAFLPDGRILLFYRDIFNEEDEYTEILVIDTET